MEDLISDPDNLKYGVAALGAVSGYVFHKLKKDKVRALTCSEIDMYLDDNVREFETGPIDEIYLKYESRQRDKESQELEGRETLNYAD